MNIRIGHSPDPDDAFLFYALTHGKLQVPGVTVSHLLEGIEQLNERALQGELEMTAISLHAYPTAPNRTSCFRPARVSEKGTARSSSPNGRWI